jgi:hypothetical protein
MPQGLGRLAIQLPRREVGEVCANTLLEYRKLALPVTSLLIVNVLKIPPSVATTALFVSFSYISLRSIS